MNQDQGIEHNAEGWGTGPSTHEFAPIHQSNGTSLPVGNGNPKNVMDGATPEQLRETVTATIYGADWQKTTALKYVHKPDVEAIMQAVATFLASIELPKKQEQVLPSQSKEDWETARDRFYRAGGYNMAITQSQAIIDKIVEELRHGAN